MNSEIRGCEVQKKISSLSAQTSNPPKPWRVDVQLARVFCYLALAGEDVGAAMAFFARAVEAVSVLVAEAGYFAREGSDQGGEEHEQGECVMFHFSFFLFWVGLVASEKFRFGGGRTVE